MKHEIKRFEQYLNESRRGQYSGMPGEKINIEGEASLTINDYDVEVKVEHQPAEFGQPAVNYLIDWIIIDGVEYTSDLQWEEAAQILGFGSVSEMEDEIISYLEKMEMEAYGERFID